MNVLRQLSLVKGAEQFVFRYPPGREIELLETLTSMAGDRESCFDWCDAAVLAWQVGRRLEMEIEPVMR